MLSSLSNKSKSISLSLPVIDIDWISVQKWKFSTACPKACHQTESCTSSSHILSSQSILLGSILTLSFHLPFHHPSSCFQGILTQIICIFCLPHLNHYNLKFWYYNTRWSRKSLSSLLFKYSNMPVSLILRANSFWSNLVLDIPPSH